MNLEPTPELRVRAAYYGALDALELAAHRFAQAVADAVTAARMYDPDGSRGDDAYAARTFASVRRSVLGALGAAPGMLQLLLSKD